MLIKIAGGEKKMNYKVSMFTYVLNCEDGSLRMYNSLTGLDSLMIVGKSAKESVLSVLADTDSVESVPARIKEALIQRGYLVSDNKVKIFLIINGL